MRLHQATLEATCDNGVADLYVEGRFPCRITLGGLAVPRAAQQSQDGGCPWGEVLEDDLDAAVRIVDLLPDAAVELARKPPD